MKSLDVGDYGYRKRIWSAIAPQSRTNAAGAINPPPTSMAASLQDFMSDADRTLVTYRQNHKPTEGYFFIANGAVVKVSILFSFFRQGGSASCNMTIYDGGIQRNIYREQYDEYRGLFSPTFILEGKPPAIAYDFGTNQHFGDLASSFKVTADGATITQTGFEILVEEL